MRTLYGQSSDENLAKASIPQEPSSSSKPLIPPPPPKSILSADDTDHLDLVTVYPTAIIVIINAFNERIPARAIFDTGTSVNVITETLARSLYIEPRDSHLQVSATDEKKLGCVREVHVNLSSRYSDFKRTISCQIASTLHASIPYRDIDFKNYEEMPKIFLADPKFYKKFRVDMIIGADVTKESFLKKSHKLNNGVYFQETSFGWVVAGTCYDKHPPKQY